MDHRNHNQNRKDISFSRPWPWAYFLSEPNAAASIAPMHLNPALTSCQLSLPVSTWIIINVQSRPTSLLCATRDHHLFCLSVAAKHGCSSRICHERHRCHLRRVGLAARIRILNISYVLQILLARVLNILSSTAIGIHCPIYNCPKAINCFFCFLINQQCFSVQGGRKVGPQTHVHAFINNVLISSHLLFFKTVVKRICVQSSYTYRYNKMLWWQMYRHISW